MQNLSFNNRPQSQLPVCQQQQQRRLLLRWILPLGSTIRRAELPRRRPRIAGNRLVGDWVPDRGSRAKVRRFTGRPFHRRTTPLNRTVVFYNCIRFRIRPNDDGLLRGDRTETQHDVPHPHLRPGRQQPRSRTAQQPVAVCQDVGKRAGKAAAERGLRRPQLAESADHVAAAVGGPAQRNHPRLPRLL